MSKREIRLLLDDMLQAAIKIRSYTEGYNYELFLEDEKTTDAVVRNFEIIGEAANRIDPQFRNQYPDIEWKRIRGFRNRIVHDYFGIDYEIVWDIIEYYLDELIDNLIKIKAANTP
jgi:uncharacterized protein with HEPN domain